MLSTRRRGNGGGAGCAGVACEHTLGRQPLHLYGYLWAKPEFITDEKCGTFSFVVPDTVVFKQQKPIKWFFTSKQDRGKILCKSKKNLSVTHVLQTFTDPTRLEASQQKSDAEQAIVATYVYSDRGHDSENVMVVEHLTASGVHHLLTNRVKPSLSVLQRFIPTRSGFDHMIQSVFTPDNCIIRKCVSSCLISDTRLSIPQRTATFEADERYVKPRDVTKREDRVHIEHMHLEMSNHLEKMIGKPVARNVAYFKTGADGRMYLLWSTMLSFEAGPLAFAKNLRLSLSHSDRIQYMVAMSSLTAAFTKAGSTAAPSSTIQLKKCPGCKTTLPAALVDFVATFKAILRAHETTPRDPLVPEVSTIPPLLDEALSPISEERFSELRQEAGFKYRTLSFCQSCASKINTAASQKREEVATISSHESPKLLLEKDKPLYMRSAHSIFWGKVEREEPARLSTLSNSLPRPASAIVCRSRPRAVRVKASTRPTSAFSTATWKRILPELVARSANAVHEGSKNCMQKLAEHLQKTFGGPSIRLALARANMFPSGSSVSLDTLQWVCEGKLLAEVFAYWTELCKAHGNGQHVNSIDIDALDAVLSTFNNSDALTHDVKSIRPRSAAILGRHANRSEVPTCTSAPASQDLTLLYPSRPRGERPHSSSANLVGYSRAMRLSHTTRTAAKVNDSNLPVPVSQQHGQQDDQVATEYRRTISGVQCLVQVMPIENVIDQRYCLQVSARTDDNEQAVGEGGANGEMRITLDTEQILALVKSTMADSGHKQLSGDVLTRLVLESLRLEQGSLVVIAQPPALANKLPPQDATTSYAIAASIDSSATPSIEAQLTADELCVLHETLGGEDA